MNGRTAAGHLPRAGFFFMSRQHRPPGPMWPIDAAWKRAIQERMQRASVSKADLAGRIGCSPSALTVLFRPGTQQSRLVPQIHRALGSDPPSTVSTGDQALKRITKLWPLLSVDARTLVEQLLAMLASS